MYIKSIFVIPVFISTADFSQLMYADKLRLWLLTVQGNRLATRSYISVESYMTRQHVPSKRG